MKKTLITLAIIVGVALAPFVTYYAFVYPYFSPLGEYYGGLSYYISGEYLTFDNGVEFKAFVDRYPIPSNCTATDFYYVDSHTRDPILHGREPDVYALEVVCSSNEYAEMKATIQAVHNGFDEEGDFINYVISVPPYRTESVQIIGFCDEKSAIRYFMATDIKSYDQWTGYEYDEMCALDWTADGTLYYEDPQYIKHGDT